MSATYSVDTQWGPVAIPSNALKYFGTFQFMIQEEVTSFTAPSDLANKHTIETALRIVTLYDTFANPKSALYDRTNFSQVVDLVNNGKFSISAFPEQLQSLADELTLQEVGNVIVFGNWADSPLLIDYCYNVISQKMVTATQQEIDQFLGVDTDWTEDESAIIQSLIANASDIKKSQSTVAFDVLD